MSQIADFTESELWIIKTTLEERYGEPVEPMLADTELRLNPYSTELTRCPAAYWEKAGCHFVVSARPVTSNTAASSITAGHEMYGTGCRGIRRPFRMHGDAAAGAGRPRSCREQQR